MAGERNNEALRATHHAEEGAALGGHEPTAPSLYVRTRRWVLVGAIWGAAAFILEGPRYMYELHFYSRVARIVGLFFPASWLREIPIFSDSSVGVLNVWPSWAAIGFTAMFSIAVGILGGFVLGLIASAVGHGSSDLHEADTESSSAPRTGSPR